MAGPNSNSHASKKSKARAPIPPDPIEASRQIAAKIAQLERETAGEKDQDAEIDQEVRKANRELTQLLAKVESPTGRVDMVRDKYLTLVADFKRLDRDYQKIKKRADQHARERDALRTDLTKSNTIKEKLAKMSRDNLAEVKVLKASLEKMEMSEIRSRRELHQRLDSMVSEVHNVVLNPAPINKVVVSAESDVEFKSKFDSFVLQHELRELQYISMLRTMHLVQLSQDARLERKSKAQELESSRTHQLSRQVSAISQTESELRSQLNVYVEKFRQVEETLNSSNDLFLTFRKEMEDMSKKTKRLEKENQHLTRKVDTSNRGMVEMADERSRLQKRYSLVEKRNVNLEKLCRGMQAQGRALPRAGLLSKSPPPMLGDFLTPLSPREQETGSPIGFLDLQIDQIKSHDYDEERYVGGDDDDDDDYDNPYARKQQDGGDSSGDDRETRVAGRNGYNTSDSDLSSPGSPAEEEDGDDDDSQAEDGNEADGVNPPNSSSDPHSLRGLKPLSSSLLSPKPTLPSLTSVLSQMDANANAEVASVSPASPASPPSPSASAMLQLQQARGQSSALLSSANGDGKEDYSQQQQQQQQRRKQKQKGKAKGVSSSGTSSRTVPPPSAVTSASSSSSSAAAVSTAALPILLEQNSLTTGPSSRSKHS